MARYTVQAPDGSTIELEGPDGASQADVIAQAQRLYAERQAPQGASAPAPAEGEPMELEITGGRTVSPEEYAQQYPGAKMPETTAAGIAGAISRGVTPAAVMAGAGALGAAALGIPAATGVALGGGALLASKLLGVDQPFVDKLNELMTRAGVAEPRTMIERLFQSAAGGAADAATGVATGRVLQSAAAPLAKAAGGILAEEPAAQLAGGVGSGVAAQLAKEAGAGPGGQLAAAIIGGGLGMAAGRRVAPSPATAAEQAKAFRGVPADVPTGAPMGQAAAPETQAEQLIASLRAARGEGPRPAPAAQAVPLAEPGAPQTRYVEPAELAAKMEAAAKTGAEGAKARTWLRTLANQDEEAMVAAQKLGVELPPDVFARQSQIREFAGLERSQKGSQASAIWRDTARDAVDKLDKQLGTLGAKFTPEGPAITQVGEEVRTTLAKKIEDLASQADTAYTQIRERIPQDARGSADDTLAFIRERAKSRETRPGEAKSAPSAFEQKALRALTPTREQVFDPMTMTTTTKEIQPTYITLDDLRKEAGAGIKGQGPFKDEDVGVLKALFARMTNDQERISSRYNTADLWKQAKGIVSERKTLESAAVAAFGSEMKNSIAPALKNAVKGNPNELQKILPVLDAVPEQLRRETFLTAIADASRAASGRGKGEFGTTQFQDVWRAMRRSKDFPQYAKALGPEATQTLDAMFKVSKVISQASSELTGTGASLQKVVNERNAASLLERMFTGGVGQLVGRLPFGRGIVDFVEGGLGGIRKKRIEATIGVFRSPEMEEIMREVGRNGEPTPETTRKFITSAAFSRFAQESGIPRGIKQREVWLREALRARQQDQSTEEPTP